MSMSKLQEAAKVREPLSLKRVQQIYFCATSETFPDVTVALCESHERLRMELESATKAANEINEMLRSFGCPESVIAGQKSVAR